MKAFLIPGNKETLDSRNYEAVLGMYQSIGYEPEFIKIKWQYKNIYDWINQVHAQVSDRELSKSILSGFSFGSMIALGAAANINPSLLLLFSLSPYFKEDMPFPKEYEKWHGKNRLKSFDSFSMNILAEKIHSPTIIFIGSKEIEKYADMKRRTYQAQNKIKNSKVVIVDSVGHDVTDPNYIKSIKHSLIGVELN